MKIHGEEVSIETCIATNLILAILISGILIIFVVVIDYVMNNTPPLSQPSCKNVCPEKENAVFSTYRTLHATCRCWYYEDLDGDGLYIKTEYYIPIFEMEIIK